MRIKVRYNTGETIFFVNRNVIQKEMIQQIIVSVDGKKVQTMFMVQDTTAPDDDNDLTEVPLYGVHHTNAYESVEKLLQGLKRKYENLEKPDEEATEKFSKTHPDEGEAEFN